MFKDKLKGFLSGVIVMSLVFGGMTVYAANKVVKGDLSFKNIKVYIDNKLFTPIDGNGDVVEPFIYNNSTYVPLKAIADGFGKNVTWDANTASVYIESEEDSIKPVVTISDPDPKSVDVEGTVTYTVTYTDNVISIIFLENNIIQNGFTANKSISESGNKRTITLSNIQGSAGEKSIKIIAGTGADDSGNLSDSATSPTFILNGTSKNEDTINPVVTISNPNPASVNVGGTVEYTVTCTDNVKVATINFKAEDIVLHGFTADKRVSGEGNVRRITLSNIQGTRGAKSISINSGIAMDTSGNLNSSETSLAFELN